ncbi:MAG: type II toxin-antitoxin system Phd/YefM family antitoxin [Streptosporangiaceae bacterium]
MAREIPVTQARADLAELVNRVGYSGERVVLTRHGRPLVALVPAADLEYLEQQAGERVVLSSFSDTTPRRPGLPSRRLDIAAEHRPGGSPGTGPPGDRG